MAAAKHVELHTLPHPLIQMPFENILKINTVNSL